MEVFQRPFFTYSTTTTVCIVLTMQYIMHHSRRYHLLINKIIIVAVLLPIMSAQVTKSYCGRVLFRILTFLLIFFQVK